MTYLAVSSVQIDTWVRIGADTEICYEVTPAHDDVVVTIGGPDGLTLNMREAALRRCVTAFTAALEGFTVGRTAQPKRSSRD